MLFVIIDTHTLRDRRLLVTNMYVLLIKAVRLYPPQPRRAVARRDVIPTQMYDEDVTPPHVHTLFSINVKTSIFFSLPLW